MTPADDARLMALAVALGRRHLGLTWPNPSVGAVLVREDGGRPVIVATGITQPGGRPHAEPVALAAAGAAARGATLYVSLEPCSHHGRTPPCADAIVRAGPARVVTALEDPDPRVAGRGHAILRAAGIAVTTGIGAEAAARAHLGHVTRVRCGRPAVLLKLARTADGFAGRLRGPRLLVTGAEANARTHLLRAQADAVLIGIGTALADDPRLDVRLPGLDDRRPVRVVVDGALRLPPDGHLARTAGSQPVWLLATERADPEREARLTALGIVVLRVPGLPDGRVDLAAGLARLGERGLTRVLCEGGPALADALARADLVDEAVLITGSSPLGDQGLLALGPALKAALGSRLAHRGSDGAGADRIDHYERITPCSPAS